jgi:hypothetical protein
MSVLDAKRIEAELRAIVPGVELVAAGAERYEVRGGPIAGDGDAYVVVLKRGEEGCWVFSDEGHTLLRTELLLEEELPAYGVEERGGELLRRVCGEGFGEAFREFLEALFLLVPGAGGREEERLAAEIATVRYLLRMAEEESGPVRLSLEARLKELLRSAEGEKAGVLSRAVPARLRDAGMQRGGGEGGRRGKVLTAAEEEELAKRIAGALGLDGSGCIGTSGSGRRTGMREGLTLTCRFGRT